MFDTAPNQKLDEQGQKTAWTVIGVLTAILVVCYFNTLWGTAEAWDSPMYSHGYLIPVFAAVLLWMRREPFVGTTLSERWWGAGVILAGTLVRLFGSHRVNFSVDRLSLIICLLGVFLLVGGRRALRWAAPAVLFMVFMFPLPGVLVDNLLRPMQTMATMGSVYALQTLGIEVYREGNRIMLEHSPMNVVDQCSGLRMTTIFVALAVAIAMISTHRPWWERVCVLLSSVPIALLVNVIRITLTGTLYNLNIDEEITRHVFHDFAGLIMMPLALGFLFLEMQILSRLVIEESAPQTPIGMGLGSR